MIKKKTIPWADPILDQKEITNDKERILSS